MARCAPTCSEREYVSTFGREILKGVFEILFGFFLKVSVLLDWILKMHLPCLPGGRGVVPGGRGARPPTLGRAPTLGVDPQL